MQSTPSNQSGPGGSRPVAVVTGASEGLGLALAREFAADGHRLLLVARNEVKLAAAAKALHEAHGVEVFYAALDLSTESGCAGVEVALAGHGLHAEYLVNNAAIGEGGFFQDCDPATLRKQVDLNVRAMADLSRRLLPFMLARGRGGILNVGSMTGFMPTPYEASYAASKAFALSFSRALAYECMYTGVQISVLMAGVIDTGFHKKAGATTSRYLTWLPVMQPEDMARGAYRGFKRRRKIIIPGFANRVLTLMASFTPYFLVVPVMGLFFRVLAPDGTALPPGPLPKLEKADEDPEASRRRAG